MSRIERIKEKLQVLSPLRLEVDNESARHAGHGGDDGSGESHLTIHLVTKVFEGMPRLVRQRRVHELLHEEMETGLHALSLDLKTPGEDMN